jgi:hypothetical protein
MRTREVALRMETLRGTVTEINPGGFGLLRAASGLEFYFDLKDAPAVAVGDAVVFTSDPRDGCETPRAHGVKAAR